MTSIGSVRTSSITAIADNAAMLVSNSRNPRAVCVDPCGVVTVEPPREAVEDEIVGVYACNARLDLWRLIEGDLKVHLAERPLARRTDLRRAA